MKLKDVPRRHRRAVVLALAVTPLAAGLPASAGTKYFVGTASPSYWSSTTSWSNTSAGAAGAPVPVTGDLVYLTNTTGLQQTISYNVSGSGVTLGGLTIDATGGSGGGYDDLTIAANTLAVGGNLLLANGGSGTVTQTGGAVTANLLYMDYNGGNGSYVMSAGTLGVTATDASGNSAYVGYNGGSATFNQSGGTTTLAGNLIVANLQNSSGTYYLTGTAKLTVSGYELLAYDPTAAASSTSTTLGTFVQNGGTHVVNGSLLMGEGYDGYAFFNLSGGTLQAGAAGTTLTVGETVGDSGYGDLYQTGGTNTVGTAAAAQLLVVGSYASGEYDLAGSGAVLAVDGDEIVGRYNGGNGIFYQVNGTHTVTGYLSVGDANGSSGKFELDAGTLSVGATATVPSGSAYGNDEIVGAAGTGTFVQTGGTNTVGSAAATQHLEIGYAAYATTGVGVYNLSGSGSTLIVYGSEYVGDGATGTNTASGGTFNQYGGTHNISGSLTVANGSGATGVFNLGGGTLTANQEFIAAGGGAYGVFTQTGGTNTIIATGTAPGVFIASNANDYGVCTVDGSGAVLTAYQLVVGGTATDAGGTGTLNIESGTVTATSQLKIWNGTGSAVNFSGGSLTVGSLNTSGDSASFNWTGGTLTIGGAITIDANFALGPTVQLGTGMTLVTTGGVTDNGTITLTGGALNASGAVVNNSLISGYGTIMATGTVTNNLQITAAAGHALALGAANLSNFGAINLAGGSITGTGTVTNAVGGTVTGPGLVSMTFANSGVVTPGAGTVDITAAWTNNGVVELSGITSAVTGGAITNNGTVQGFGSIGVGIANDGTIEATGGTLVIGGAPTNPAGGILVASSGGKLLISSGLAVNAGLISLTGGTFDNGGAPLTNTGQITGYGTLRTGGLTNAGTITLSGTSTNATTTVNGAVTNNAGASITIQNQPAIFTGNITNNGTITTIGTTVTFGGTYTGNAYHSDPSTNVFESNVTIVPGGTMTGTAADTFEFYNGVVTNNGTFTNAGPLYSTDDVTNNGTFGQTGTQSWSTAATFTNAAGTATFGTDTGAAGAELTVNVTGGAVTFASTQHLAGLSVAAGSSVVVTSGSNRSVVVTSALTDNGTIDLTDSDLDITVNVTAGTLAAVTALVRQGYDLTGGAGWTGTGITSSTAAAEPGHLNALGVIRNNQSGTAIYTAADPFDGIVPGSGDILVKYTYFGDANLDGKVDGSDYTLIDAGYASHGTLTGWYYGDFNYDGVVDGSDYALIDNAFNNQSADLSAEAVMAAEPGAQTAPAAAPAAVPEPRALAAMVAVFPFIARRRIPRRQ